MARPDLSPPRRTRLGIAVLVVALHLLAVLALIRAFAPRFSAEAVERVTAVFTLEVTPPDPPKPSPAPEKRPDPAGAAGRKAVPREAAVIRPTIVVASPRPAPPLAGKGDSDAAGTRDAGAGTGAGGPGSGTGAGGGGAKAAKIAGDINSARDYPRKTRELRLGDHVVVALTVGIDGRVRSCRVHRPSRDPEADRITCRLATERFRFRPAADAQGRPVESVYGWQQRWYASPGKD